MGRANGRRLESERREVTDTTKDVGFYNPHDGVKGRDGGPYLDFVERQQAEINRAAAEGREPDLENPPATTGTPLVTVSELVDNSTTGNVSRRNAPGLETAIDDSNFDEDDKLADPVSVLPVDFATDVPSDAFDPTKNDAPSGSPGNSTPSEPPTPAATKEKVTSTSKDTSK